MKKIPTLQIVYAAAAAIVISFFLNWVTVATTAGSIAKGAAPFGGVISKITGAMNKAGADITMAKSLSGFDIPRLAAKGDSPLLKTVGAICGFSTKGARVKSLVVYLVPLGAILCAVLVMLGLKKNILLLYAATAISGAASIGGFIKIMMTDLASLPVQVAIGLGIWITLAAFFVIFLASAYLLYMKRK